MDEKSTNMYDIKLAEYAQPVCVDNLDVDTQHAADQYHSDQLFTEEKKVSDINDSMLEVDQDQYRSPNAPNNDQIVESKEYLEINFKFNYDGEDESPVKLDLGIAGKQDSTPG